MFLVSLVVESFLRYRALYGVAEKLAFLPREASVTPHPHPSFVYEALEVALVAKLVIVRRIMVNGP